MAIGKFTENVATYLSGRMLKMFRFDCYDSGMGKSAKLKQIVHWYYKNNPPKGFEKPKEYSNEHNM